MLMYYNDYKIYGAKIYRTDEMGEISIDVNSNQKAKVLYKFNKNSK